MDLFLQGIYLPRQKLVTSQQNSYQYKKSYWIELQKKKKKKKAITVMCCQDFN